MCHAADTDATLLSDSAFRVHVQRYANSQDTFFREYAMVNWDTIKLGVYNN